LSTVTKGRSFGEEGARLTYGSYLRVPQLLAQQVPQVDPPAHDELLFITVHQAYEPRCCGNCGTGCRSTEARNAAGHA
jgi:hypothetical protein